MQTDADASLKNRMAYRWVSLWNALGLQGDPAAMGRVILDALSAPGREAHSLDYLQMRLRWADNARAMSEAPDQVAMALWLQSVIHDVERSDNVSRSAVLAVDRLRACGMREADAENIRALILVTRSGARARRTDERIIQDIDLCEYALEPEAFERFEQDLRLEHRHVPLPAWRAMRRRFFQGLRSRKPLYQIGEFRTALEPGARENIESALLRLRPQ